jgi:hypothetical protein
MSHDPHSLFSLTKGKSPRRLNSDARERSPTFVVIYSSRFISTFPPVLRKSDNIG